MKYLASVLFLFVSISLYAAEPRTQICDFEGENDSAICSLTTMPGIGTTFRLPDGVNIRDFVITDTVNFYAESNGVIGVVTPRTTDKSTSIIIYGNNDRLYMFYLSSESSPKYVDQLAVIKSSDIPLFQSRLRLEAQIIAQDRAADLAAKYSADLERETAQIRKHLLFSVNNNYQITGNVFSIDSVSDDGVFTYVKLARSQERPVVYFGKSGKPRELEVIKYTDEGDHYIIHRVLTASDKDNGLVLKLGDKMSEIKRR